MFEPIPEPSNSKGSDYLVWKLEDDTPIKSHRLRIMGTAKSPNTFMQCYQVFDSGDKPHREPFISEDIPPSDELKSHLRMDKFKPGELEKVKVAWVFTIWHMDYTLKDGEPIKDERPMIWNVTQKTIKDMLLAYARNPKWGGEDENKKPLKDASRYVIEVSRETADKTTYSVFPEPPSEPAPQEIVDAMDAAMIDVRVQLLDKSDPKANDGNPFGALATNGQPMDTQVAPNDQANIQELRDAGEPIPMPKRKPVDDAAETVHSVGSITRDAIETLQAAKDKAEGLAPEMKDGMPY